MYYIGAEEKRGAVAALRAYYEGSAWLFHSVSSRLIIPRAVNFPPPTLQRSLEHGVKLGLQGRAVCVVRGDSTTVKNVFGTVTESGKIKVEKTGALKTIEEFVRFSGEKSIRHPFTRVLDIISGYTLAELYDALLLQFAGFPPEGKMSLDYLLRLGFSCIAIGAKGSKKVGIILPDGKISANVMWNNVQDARQICEALCSNASAAWDSSAIWWRPKMCQKVHL